MERFLRADETMAMASKVNVLLSISLTASEGGKGTMLSGEIALTAASAFISSLATSPRALGDLRGRMLEGGVATSLCCKVWGRCCKVESEEGGEDEENEMHFGGVGGVAQGECGFLFELSVCFNQVGVEFLTV